MLFTFTKDLTYGEKKEAIDCIRGWNNKFNNVEEFPFCMEYFSRMFPRIMDIENIEHFFHSDGVEKIPNRFAEVLEQALKSCLDISFWRDYEDTDGVTLYFKLVKNHRILSNFQRLELLRHVFHPELIYSSDFKSKLKMLEYHFPHLKPFMSSIALLRLDPHQASEYLSQEHITRASMNNIKELEKRSIEDILQSTKKSHI